MVRGVIMFLKLQQALPQNLTSLLWWRDKNPTSVRPSPTGDWQNFRPVVPQPLLHSPPILCLVLHRCFSRDVQGRGSILSTCRWRWRSNSQPQVFRADAPATKPSPGPYVHFVGQYPFPYSFLEGKPALQLSQALSRNLYPRV